MMTFEDIVDMDWLDSHSVKGEPADLFSNDYVDFNHYLSADLLSPKLEHASSPPLLMASSPPSGFMNTPATSCSAAAALAAATTTPPPPLTFPTTEQIKQLIELAKHQLALRASQTNGNNNSVNNTNSASCSSSNQDVPIKSETASSSTTSSSGAAVSSSDSSTSPSASHLAAHLANTNLFGNSSNLPDTVSPEYLMKPPTTTSAVADQQQRQPTDTSSMLSKSTLINTEQDGINSSPSSLDNNVLTPMDTTEESTTTSATKMKKAPSSSLSSLPSNNNASARRDSLLGDDIGSLEAYAESDGIDIKKLTPKERRQLRNKISARNFRVRRKEYITTLEQQVNDHKKHAEGLAERLGMVENENKQLRQEVDTLKRQNLLLQQQQILQPQAC